MVSINLLNLKSISFHNIYCYFLSLELIYVAKMGTEINIHYF